MGGALATLLGLAHKPDEICTFGAPRVAGKEIFTEFNDIEFHRIVTEGDWISFLPPNIPFILPYRHVGKEFLLPSRWNWKDITRPHLLATYLNALLEELDLSNS